MRALAIAVLLGACGSSTGPSSRIAHPSPPPPPAPPTCAEIGIIMRGYVENTSPDAGLEREKAIERSCAQEHWPQPVIECAASTTAPNDCLASLSAMQRAAYDARLKAWAEKWNVTDVAGTVPNGPMTLACSEALHAVELFDPVIDPQTPERDWAIATRARVLEAQCQSVPWTEDAKVCLMAAQSETDTALCVAQLDPNIRATLMKIADVATAIAKIKKTPKKLECKELVKTQHMSAERCAAADVETRACLVAGGGDDLCH